MDNFRACILLTGVTTVLKYLLDGHFNGQENPAKILQQYDLMPFFFLRLQGNLNYVPTPVICLKKKKR